MKSEHSFSFLCLAVLQVVALAAGERVRMCYYTSWSQNQNFTVANIDPTLCTHIICSFGYVNSVDDTIAVAQPDLELFKSVIALKSGNPNLKVLLAIGGYNVGTWDFEVVARDDVKREQFARNVLAFLRQHDFDGLDVDWEYPNTHSRYYYRLFLTSLMQQFKQDPEGRTRLLLTVSVSANHEIASSSYDPSALSSTVDYFLLMTYDFWGPWISRLAHHSPLYVRPEDVDDADLGRFSANKTVQKWVDLGVSKDQLVLGFSAHARTGRLTTSPQHNLGDRYTMERGQAGRVTGTSGVLAYYEVCEKLSHSTWVSQYDNDSKVPYAYGSDHGAFPWDWVSYDNPTSFRAKAQYVVDQGLAGAMVWSLENDDFTGLSCRSPRYPLISAIKEVFAGSPAPVTARPPTSASSTATTSSPGPPSMQSTPTPQPFSESTLSGREFQDCPANFTCPQQFGLFPDCANCSNFYQCSFSISWSMKCPTGLLWNRTNNYCDWPYNVNCPVSR